MQANLNRENARSEAEGAKPINPKLARRVHALLQDYQARAVLDAMIRDLRVSWPKSEGEIADRLERAGF